MGIPYSREINAAFDQVTPLVAEVDRILRTMHNISIIVAVIQVLTVVLLFAILLVLVLIVYSVNPDLEVRFALFLTFFLSPFPNLSTFTPASSAVFPIAH